jgi:hypothetical protein
MEYGDTMIAVLIAIESTRGTLITVQRSSLARRAAAEELFLLRELRAYVRSFSFGRCRQRTQLSTSPLSARCLACHAARHELMVVYRQKCAKVVYM